MALTTLPYPSMDFVPLDILTAEEMNQLVANIEAINNATIGTNQIADNAITTAKLNNASVTSSKIDWTTLGSNFKIAQKTNNTALTLANQFFCEIDISDIPNGTVLWIFAKMQVGDTGGNGNTVAGAISDQSRASVIPGSSFYTNLSWGTTTLTSAMYVKDSSKTQLNLFVRKENNSAPCNLNNATLVVVPISNQK